jgi:hypothetical protein
MMNFGLVSNVDLSKVHQCYGQPVEVPKELSNVVAKKRNPVEATLRKNRNGLTTMLSKGDRQHIT